MAMGRSKAAPSFLISAESQIDRDSSGKDKSHTPQFLTAALTLSLDSLTAPREARRLQRWKALSDVHLNLNHIGIDSKHCAAQILWLT